MRSLLALLFGALLLFAAGCGSDGLEKTAASDDATETIVALTATAAPTSTEAPTTTEVPATTTAPSTTEAPEPDDAPRTQQAAMRDLTLPGNPEVANTNVTLEVTDNEIDVVVTTNGLTPGNPMTAWLIALYVEPCKEAFPALQPCQPFMLTALDRPDLGNIRQLGGGIASDDGSITISGSLTTDGLPADTPEGELMWWYDTELTDLRDMLFHVIIHDHGPPIDGIVDEMWGTFRGGCTEVSLGPGLPDNALNDGPGGPNTCINAQGVPFEPVNGFEATSSVTATVNGTLKVVPATVPNAGEHELVVNGSGFIGGTGILLGPCIAPGPPLVPGESTGDEVAAALGAIDPFADCRLEEAITVAVDDDGGFTVTTPFDVSGRPDDVSPQGTNFVVAAGSLDLAQAGAVWLPLDG